MLPVDLLPDVPSDPVAAMLVGRDIMLVLMGRRATESTRNAIVRVARAISMGAWS